MEVKKHELIEQNLCNALDEFENKLRQGQKMGPNDYMQLKEIYSALIKKKAYEGMLEYDEYGGEEGFSGYSGEGGGGGNSGRRGRAANGRFVSRDAGGGNSGASYEAGYSQGYSEAMSQMMSRGQGGGSGHYPMMDGMYPRGPRW